MTCAVNCDAGLRAQPVLYDSSNHVEVQAWGRYVVWSFRVTREDLRTCWDHLPFRASPSCGAWVRTAQACRVLGSCPGAPLLLCLSLHLAAGAGMKQNHWGEVCREGLVFARVHSALA